jgi:outer membrane protein OmpA-like peptidoglycan-associated protein
VNTINTPGKEITPFLASDGVTLYFSSNGHPGYGNNDVFMTRRLDDSWANWSKPLNVGQPVNGPGLDSYYSVPADGEYAYFVSSGEGFDTDIFQIKVPEKVKPKPVVIIKGTVRNSKTNEPLSSRITYRDFVVDKEVGTAHSDPVTGRYEIVLPLEKAYALFAQKDGFYSVSDHLDLTGVKNFQVIEKDLYLSPIEVGQSTQLHNVLFVRSKAVLLPGSQAELNRLVKQLAENPSMNIEVSGHTDNVGNPELNKKLSEDRANKVRQYLIDKGIESTRIVGVGFGGEKPIADNSREDTRKLNRRVEFLITSY